MLSSALRRKKPPPHGRKQVDGGHSEHGKRIRKVNQLDRNVCARQKPVKGLFFLPNPCLQTVFSLHCNHVVTIRFFTFFNSFSISFVLPCQYILLKAMLANG